MPTGVVCDLRDALFVNAVLVLPNGSTMYAKDISADNVTNAIYVRLLADRELTTEGNYSILFNVKLVDGVMYSTVAVNFANVTTNADAEYKEIVLSSNLEVTDNPHNVQRTGASPKVSTRQTWLVYNDEAKAYEDTGIPAEVNLGDYYTKVETDEKVAELKSNVVNISINGRGESFAERYINLIAGRKYKLYVVNTNWAYSGDIYKNKLIIAYYKDGVQFDIEKTVDIVKPYYIIDAVECDNNNQYTIFVRADVEERVLFLLEDITDTENIGNQVKKMVVSTNLKKSANNSISMNTINIVNMKGEFEVMNVMAYSPFIFNEDNVILVITETKSLEFRKTFDDILPNDLVLLTYYPKNEVFTGGALLPYLNNSELLVENKSIKNIKNASAVIGSNDLHWTIGESINSNGETVSSVFAAHSDLYHIGSFNRVCHSYPIYDENGIEIFTAVCQYNNDGGFIRRDIFHFGGIGNAIELDINCRDIIFVINRLSSTGVPFSQDDLDYFYARLDVAGKRDITTNCNLTHLSPDNVGQLNAVKRARQMTDIEWTPAFDIPRLGYCSGYPGESYAETDYGYFGDVFKAGKKYRGIPYARADKDSSNWGFNTFKVGIYIDFETFITAISNKGTIVEKESKLDVPSHNASFYATVCSAMVCYALGLDYLYTASFPSYPGMVKKGSVPTIDLATLKLGDILNSPVHTAMITDVIIENGLVKYVEVSEGTPLGNENKDVLGTSLEGGDYGGVCRRLWWSAADFVNEWGIYNVYRWNGVENVQYSPSPYVQIGDEVAQLANRQMACLPYVGNGFQYRYGKIENSDILINVTGFNKMRILKNGVNWNEDGTTGYYDITGLTKISIGFEDVGNYIAYLCNVENGIEVKKTKPCNWSVVA